MNANAGRVERLAATMRDEGIKAIFLSSPNPMGYLQGFFEDGHERLLVLAVRQTGEVRLIAPALSAAQARRLGIEDVRGWEDGQDPRQFVEELAQDWDLRSAVIAVDDAMRASSLLTLQATLPAALFRTADAVLARVMGVKDADEIEKLRRAGAIADQALAAGLAAIRPGASETSVADALIAEMKRLGGKPTFCIVATGANSAEPHHLTDDTLIREGDVVLLDFGCTFERYQSDITRTVSCGEPTDPEAPQVYEIVYRAHQAARRAIRPGVTGEAIDAAARQVIESAAYGDRFIHRTGHGIGLGGHEEPNIVKGQTTPLQPGACFSIEPGIYLEGRFGVRIENIVTVTEQGHHSLNDEPASTLLTIA